MPDPFEHHLRDRLERYGAVLEEAADAPARRPRHLVVVDGPVGGGRAPRRTPWRGPVGRVAAVLVVLAALAGTTWAATRPSEPATTTTEGRWDDDDIVRPEDRRSAFAALDGTWALPEGGSLLYVLDRPTDRSTTFAGFRQTLAYNASCLWFRFALEEPQPTDAEREEIAAIPTWPSHGPMHNSAAESLQEVTDAALAGDDDRLGDHLRINCTGTGEGLGLPELGGFWLRPGGTTAPEGAPTVDGGSATVVDPAEVRGWDAIAARLGPEVTASTALALPDGGTNVSLSHRGLDLSLTIGTIDGPLTLPVTDAAFRQGHTPPRDGVEVYAGPVRDERATLVTAVGAGGRSVTLSAEVAPDRLTSALGDLDDLALDLHAAAWPR